MGWRQADDGRWFPPVSARQDWTVQIPASHSVEPSAGDARQEAGRRGLVDAYRRWPLWARMGIPATAAILVLGVIGSLGSSEPQVVEMSQDVSETTTTERAVTSEAPAPPTSPATTVPPAPPVTTAPPVTAPPATVPPVTAPPAPPEPEPAGSCHPSYDPCVPNASDVDCGGGSGDGPEYVSGTVTVIGPDVFDLDRDGDGYGCD